MNKKHLIFISYELYPINPGGCGVFLWNAIKRFLEDDRLEITILLDMPKHECELFEKEHKPTLKNSENLNIVCLSELIQDIPTELSIFNNIFMLKSFQFYKGLEKISKQKRVDYIEFFDYVGIGFFTIRAKKYESQFQHTKIGVRGHCTIDLMDLNQNQIDLSPEKVEMYKMEKMALKDADFVLLQSKSWDEIYSRRYDVDMDKIIISPPPLDSSDFPKFTPKENNNNVLFYGRLFQLKGIDQLIDAGVLYLRRNKNSETKFYIVGYDSTTTTGESYKEYLIRKIPKEYRDRFVFTGKLNRAEFKHIMDDINMAVFPNYVESFCYSIHEIYEAGVPIICRSIPAFDDYFTDNENCLKFEDNVVDLCSKIEILSEDKNLQSKISYPYKVMDDSLFLEPYYKILNKDINHQKISVEHEQEKISVIMLSKNKNMNDIFNNELISEKSYILKKKEASDNDNDYDVKFLGEEYCVQNSSEHNEDLMLEKYVMIMNEDDYIEGAFLEKGLEILKNSPAKYVTSIYKDIKIERVVYDKSDIYKEDSKKTYNQIKSTLMKLDKSITVGDLYDQRLNGCGQTERLWEDSYTIPTFYNRLGTTEELNILDSNRALLIHRNMKDAQWNPFNLVNEEKIVCNSNLESEVIQMSNHEKKRELYHDLRKISNRMGGIRGKLISIALDYIHLKVKNKKN